MSVEIDPLELSFRRPFTVEVAQALKLKNQGANPVAFKVKTTAPKQYCVRPNSGRIEPGHEVEVSVLLQAMKQEPAPDARCRDKFLVQSVTITSDQEFTNVQQIWDGVEKSAVQEKKIRVTWLAPSDGVADAAATPARPVSLANGIDDTPNVPPPAYASPGEDNTQATAVASDNDVELKDLKGEPEPSPTATTTIKKTVAATYEELKNQLAKAEATIATLKDEAASGLRQRKVNSAEVSEKVAAKSQELAQAVRQGTEGVPIHIVAGLCLFSFLLAYFFF
ncbi:VAMP-associated protein [Thozetella sp. PMI_491]|nr:VAMP-associated protein [Thozetella sp. PMI_491]